MQALAMVSTEQKEWIKVGKLLPFGKYPNKLQLIAIPL